MQDLKSEVSELTGFTSQWGNILNFFQFSRDSVESRESIEFKDNYGKTRIFILVEIFYKQTLQ